MSCSPSRWLTRPIANNVWTIWWAFVAIIFLLNSRPSLSPIWDLEPSFLTALMALSNWTITNQLIINCGYKQHTSSVDKCTVWHALDTCFCSKGILPSKWCQILVITRDLSSREFHVEFYKVVDDVFHRSEDLSDITKRQMRRQEFECTNSEVIGQFPQVEIHQHCSSNRQLSTSNCI